MIRSQITDGVALITIARPEKANSLPEAGKRSLALEIENAGRRDDVRALVLTGEGERSFCGGSDIVEMKGFDASAMYRMLSAERAMYLAALRIPKPIVAAVNGYALGAGLILTMVCDYAVASPTARFGAPELTLGVAAPLEGFLLPWIVGFGRARALFYTGKHIQADEALEMGLVQELVEQSSCRARAAEVALQIAELPSDAFPVQKRLLYRLVSTGNMDAVIEESHYATAFQFTRPDTAQGIELFLSRKG